MIGPFAQPRPNRQTSQDAESVILRESMAGYSSSHQSAGGDAITISPSAAAAVEEERNQWYEAAINAAHDLQGMTLAWDKARDALDAVTDENMRALAYSIAQRNVAERLAAMGGVVIVDENTHRQQKSDRQSKRSGRSRTRRSRSRASSAVRDSHKSASGTSNGTTDGLQKTQELACVDGRGGERQLVLTGFDLEAALRVDDIDEARGKLRWLHDHAAQLESMLDEFEEDNVRVVENNHKLAMQVIEQGKAIEEMKKELEEVTGAYYLAIDYGGVGTEGAISEGDSSGEKPLPSEQRRPLSLEGAAHPPVDPSAVAQASPQAPLPPLPSSSHYGAGNTPPSPVPAAPAVLGNGQRALSGSDNYADSNSSDFSLAIATGGEWDDVNVSERAGDNAVEVSASVEGGGVGTQSGVWGYEEGRETGAAMGDTAGGVEGGDERGADEPWGWQQGGEGGGGRGELVMQTPTLSAPPLTACVEGDTPGYTDPAQQQQQEKDEEEVDPPTPYLAPPPTNLPHPGQQVSSRRPRPPPKNSAFMSTAAGAPPVAMPVFSGARSNPFGAGAGGVGSGYSYGGGSGGAGSGESSDERNNAGGEFATETAGGGGSAGRNGNTNNGYGAGNHGFSPFGGFDPPPVEGTARAEGAVNGTITEVANGANEDDGTTTGLGGAASVAGGYGEMEGYGGGVGTEGGQGFEDPWGGGGQATGGDDYFDGGV